jgi:UDP-glucose 4-epimerase
MTGTSCLVTGGAGFIGSHVAERLVALGHHVRVVDNLSTGSLRNLDWAGGRLDFVEGDLTREEVCRAVTRDVEVIFHLAALPSVPRSMVDPWASHDHNVNATLRLLLAAREAGVRRVCFSSSSSVYGNTPVLPKVEASEPLPRSPYATAKLAAEQYVLAFARAGVLEGVALRYFNVFGPRQSPHSAYAAVIPAFLAAAREGRPAPLHGDGEQTRDFTYVENVVQANLLAATLPAERVNGWTCNVGAGERTSLRQLVQLVREVSGRDLTVESLPERPGDVRDSLASLVRAGEVLGYAPTVDLQEGLGRTWKWLVGEPARR